MFRSVISSGANSLKAAMIINGGGAVALLAFIARVKESALDVDIQMIAGALLIFSMGALLTALASGFTYFTQRLYSSGENIKHGHVLTVVTSFIVGGSLGLFAIGVFMAAKALGFEFNAFW